jgi:hypothetical protein
MATLPVTADCFQGYQLEHTDDKNELYTAEVYMRLFAGGERNGATLHKAINMPPGMVYVKRDADDGHSLREYELRSQSMSHFLHNMLATPRFPIKLTSADGSKSIDITDQKIQSIMYKGCRGQFYYPRDEQMQCVLY